MEQEDDDNKQTKNNKKTHKNQIKNNVNKGSSMEGFVGERSWLAFLESLCLLSWESNGTKAVKMIIKQKVV